MEKIRFSLYGYGKVAQLHAKALAACEKAQLVSVCGRDIKKAQAFASQWGIQARASAQEMAQKDGAQAVIVTTPQKVAAIDVRKSISFCRQLNVPVLGVVENMSGFICPKCGEVTQILPEGGGRKIAADMNVPFLGAIPLDQNIAQSGDSGKVFIYHASETPTGKIMQGVIDQITELEQTKKLDS